MKRVFCVSTWLILSLACNETKSSAPTKAQAPVVPDHAECNEAYDELSALLKGFAEQVAAQQPAELQKQSTAPRVKRAEFVRSCASLPVSVQPCMKLSYAVSQKGECKKRFDALPPGIKAQAERLMTRGK